MREAVRALILDTIRRLQPVTEQLLIDELGAHAPARPVLAGYLVKLEVQGAIGRDRDKRYSVRQDQIAAEISARDSRPDPAPPEPENEPPQGDDMPAKTRTCEGCEEDLPIGDFRKSGRGFAKQCKDCEAGTDDRPAKLRPPPATDLAPVTALPAADSRVLIRVPSSVGPVEVEISAQAGLEFLRSLLKVA